MKTCQLCNGVVTEEWEWYPITGVDTEVGDWEFNANVILCSDCYDYYCVKNDIGTLDEALTQGITITFYPFD